MDITTSIGLKNFTYIFFTNLYHVTIMYLQSVLRLLLLCVLVAELGNVQAKGTVSLAPFDEEAKLRDVQDERRIESLTFDNEEGIVSLVPGQEMSPMSTERRRGWFKKLRRKLKRKIRRWWKKRMRKGVRFSYSRRFR